MFFVRRRRVSFFLLFRCWGITNSVAVCGFPCVSSSCTRPSSSTRTPLSTTSSRSPPAPVFCFRLAVGGGFRSVLVLVGLSLFLSRSLSLSFRSCLHCMNAVLLRDKGGGLPDGAPNHDYDGVGFFRGQSMGQCPGRSIQNCPCSPHFLPQPSKIEAGRGSGGATVLSDKRSCVSGGLPVFFCFVQSGSCPLPFFWQSSPFLRVGLCDKFSGASFCLLFSFCFLWFLVGICLCFCLVFCKFALEMPKKFSSCQVLFLLARSLCLRGWVDDVFLFHFSVLFSLKETAQG